MAVRYGHFSSTRREMFAYYDVYQEPDSNLALDYYFWILRNDDRTVLVDTGFDPAVGRRRGREVTTAPADALQRLNIDPSSVTDVVLTHFHYDHIGNIDLFPEARLLASAREFEFWIHGNGRHPAALVATETDELHRLRDARDAGRLELISDPASDSAVIPGVECIDLPGHTPGALGVSIATDARRVVLASDAAHFCEEYERHMPFYLYTDLDAMYRSLDTLRELTARPDMVVVAGHDPLVMRQFPPVSDELRDVAVRLS